MLPLPYKEVLAVGETNERSEAAGMPPQQLADDSPAMPRRKSKP